MSYKILVMSPLHNMGATVTSLLMAQAAVYAQKISNIVFTHPDSNLPNYLGLNNIRSNPVRSVDQLIKLIDIDALDDANIIDYAYPYFDNAYLMDVADPTIEGIDRLQIINYVFSKVKVDWSFCDNSEEIDTPLSQALVESADIVFLVTDMSRKCREHVVSWMQSPVLESKNVYVLVNRYDEVIMSVRNLAKTIQMPSSHVCKIHYNPWIARCTNNFSLQTLMPLAWKKDPRVANLQNDIAEILQAIGGEEVFKVKKVY